MRIMASQFHVWYESALKQTAAESYLDQIDTSDRQRYKEALLRGNNRLGCPSERGFSRFTDPQAEQFVDRVRVVQHYANDSSGFSATLLFDTQTNEYTLSIRSTEFRNQRDGGDFERDGPGAGADIAGKGFAFAQIASMEHFYREVVEPAVGTAKLNVTGYSLGGHLATIFTELHPDAVSQTHLFNAAGRGGLKPGSSIQKVVEIYEAVLASPEAWRRYVPGLSGLDERVLYQRARYIQNSGRRSEERRVGEEGRSRWAP